MSKSKRIRNRKKPLKVGFILQDRESHQRLEEITDYEVQTRIPEPNVMHEGFCPRRCTSLLAPRIFRAAGEYEKSESESEESPEMSAKQFHVKPTESPCKATERSEESPIMQPRSSCLRQGFGSSKWTTSSTPHSCSATFRECGQLAEPSKNTSQNHAKQTKTPCKSTEKTVNASTPKRRNVSRKPSPSPAPGSRIIGGGSRASSPSSESSKLKDQSLAKLTKTLCKVAGKPENQLENCTKSMLKSTCSDSRSSRRESCVSFHDPVCVEIPYCDPICSMEPDHPKPRRESPKSDLKKCSCPKIDHSKPHCTGEHKSLKKLFSKSKPHGIYKRPVIVVPLGEGSPKVHKAMSNHKTSSSPSLQNPIEDACQVPHSASCPNSKLKSYIPYSRSSFHHVDSLNKLHVGRAACQHQDPSPQCGAKSKSCGNCTDLSQQIHQLTEKVNCLEATLIQMSDKPKKDESPKLESKLSTCAFCRGQNLPILNSFRRQLKEAIGCRGCTEVVISIFLRADNIYHVNVRDLKSGCSLACFLVTDDGIMEVQKLGLFREILTFCVVDVRNTLKPKNCALGITFELVDPDRQKGGCDTVNHGLCLTCRPFLARILSQPLHRLRHVYTDPAIFNNYIKKSLKEKPTSTNASPDKDIR